MHYLLVKQTTDRQADSNIKGEAFTKKKRATNNNMSH